MADLIARLPITRRMQHVYDAEYFAWCYRNPFSTYRFLYWVENELKGSIILHTPARPGIHPVTIVDWEVQTLVMRSELLKTAIRLGDFEQLTIWGASLSTETMDLLHQSGFVFKADTPNQEDHQPEILPKPSGIESGKTDWQLGDLSLPTCRIGTSG